MRVTQKTLNDAVTGVREASLELAPVIHRCAAVGARKAGGAEHTEDVEQELWLFLITHRDRIDTNYNLEPYLIETARKVALTRKRRYSAFGTDGEDNRGDEVADLAGVAITVDWGAEDGTIDDADQQTAIDYLLKHNPALTAAIQKQGVTGTMKVRVPSNNITTRARLNKDQRKLRAVRHRLGLSQIELAARIGITLTRLQSYEYGRTKGVNPKVMAALDRLDAGPEADAVAFFEAAPIVQVAKEWMARLGIRDGAYGALGEILMLDRTTVWRWFNGGQQPDARTMAGYERIVSAVEAALDSGSKFSRARQKAAAVKAAPKSKPKSRRS